MRRAAKLPARALGTIRPVTGAAAEPARLAAADDGTQPWRAWRVAVVAGGLVLEDTARGVSLRLEVAVEGHPTTFVAEQATPTWSHVRASAGDLVTVELARRGPRDAIVRVLVRAPAQGPAALDVRATLGAAAPSPDEPAPRPRVAWEATGAPQGSTVVRLDASGGESWWLVDAHHACVEPTPAPEQGEAGRLVLSHHVELEPGRSTDVALRLSVSEEPRSPVGPDAAATLAVRARESDAWLGASLGAWLGASSLDAWLGASSLDPSSRDAGAGTPLVRRLVAELLTGGPRPASATALDAVALATFDPSRARAVLLESLGAWAHELTEPTGGPADPADGPGGPTDRPEGPTDGPRDPTDGPGVPPLGAWAALRVHDLSLARTGREDPDFLEEACSRLLTATSWWVDRLDPDGRGALHGGLPSVDGPRVLPRGVVDGAAGLAHAEGAAWLAVHMTSMLGLATTIARIDPGYEDMAVTFLDTVVTMIDSLDGVGAGLGMWDEAHGTYLDVARTADGAFERVPLRSLVSLLPLLAVTTIPGETLERLPALADRVDATLAERPELSGSIIRGHSGRRDRGDVLVAVVNRSRLGWALEHVLDPNGYLSPFGIRTLSRTQGDPVHVDLGGTPAEVRYRPAGARDTDGGPLWQGQVSVTLTCLLADALRAHGRMRGSPLLLPYPTGSGRTMVADEVADDLVTRVLHALGRLATDDQPVVGVDAIDAESGGPARPRGPSGRSSLPLAFLAAVRPTR